MVERRERFVTTRQFLETARSYDITEEECILEALDNSIDANARNIRIHVGKTKRDEPLIVIEDDGVGIPSMHIDEDGIEHEGIPFILAYGGRIPHAGKPVTIGKFGWGLSQAASSISRRTEVYTKTVDDKEWRYGYYDFEELENDPRCELPTESEINPPWISLPENGTIVMFHMDRSDVRRTGWLVNRLEEMLGRTYRKFLGMGREIVITHESGGKNERVVVGIEDPLHQMPGSKEVNMFGQSKGPYRSLITLDGSNSLGLVIDPTTGQEAVISVRMCLIDSRLVREKLGIESTGGKSQKELKKWGITDENQGFSVLRNGREIRMGETLGLWSKASQFAYIRSEIEFPEVLDRLFNVQVNKSRFTINHVLRSVLQERCMGTIRDLVREHKEGVSKARVRNAKRAVSTAEVIASVIAEDIPKPKVSKLERKEAEAEIKKRIDAKIEQAEIEGDQKIQRAQSDLDTADKDGDKQRVESAKKAVKAAKEEKKKTVRAIHNRFEFKSPFRKEFGVLGSGDMYAIEHLGDEVWITMNTDTPFFRIVYERALMSAEMESLLDLMIFAMAWAEHLKRDEPTIKEFWEGARPVVSQMAHTFCNSMRLEDES